MIVWAKFYALIYLVFVLNYLFSLLRINIRNSFPSSNRYTQNIAQVGACFEALHSEL